ncbi:MAG: hypothetical protein CL927_20465 [Deltaproteobacteria bacterium]|nr:hypothetical protein [Deltaproteobacteria bacterium]HCH64715.1 hypothetical protein [Deltaproteobacteria bacterium]
MGAVKAAGRSSPEPATLTQEDHQQRVIQAISWYGIIISCTYAFLYVLLEFHLFGLTTFGFAVFYVVVFVLSDRTRFPVRTLGISFMFVVLMHTTSLGTLFISPTTGLHLWGIIVPFFCIITVSARDWIWSTLFSTAACGVLCFLEWNKETYIPPLGVEVMEELVPWVRTFTVLTIVLFVAGIFWLYHRNLSKAREDLQQSFDRSELLLLNILPASIASRLKEETRVIADDISEASVLFCDLVGFTPIASEQTALETVKMLNGVFVAFDEATAARGLEKIKTIGDAYMVASGVPNARAGHAIELMHLAIEFLEILEEYNATEGYDLSLRIGINCGPLTAGVIGKHKFSYDLWGDTVNVASRMESSGIPGRIQVTEAVVNATGSAFSFEPRESVTIKGKGQMKTFLLGVGS